MKNDPLGTLLVGLALFSALTAAGLCLTYVQSVRALQRLQPQVAAIGQNRTVIQQLLLKSAEYAKTNANPVMTKILKDIGIEIKATAAEAARPTVAK